MTAAPGPQQPDEVDRVAYGSLRGRPRVMGTCPACGVANLALSEGLPYVVCGNLNCADPTAPSAVLGRAPAPPDEVRRAVTDEQGRICRCDGGAYEIKRHPFLVHPDCAIHRTPAQPVRDTEELDEPHSCCGCITTACQCDCCCRPGARR